MITAFDISFYKNNYSLYEIHLKNNNLVYFHTPRRGIQINKKRSPVSNISLIEFEEFLRKKCRWWKKDYRGNKKYGFDWRMKIEAENEYFISYGINAFPRNFLKLKDHLFSLTGDEKFVHDMFEEKEESMPDVRWRKYLRGICEDWE